MISGCGRKPEPLEKPLAIIEIESQTGQHLLTFTVKQNLTDLTQQLRQTQHLSCEHSQADEDGVELADGASDVPRSYLPQVHGKHAESYTYEEEQGFNPVHLRTVFQCGITAGLLC